MTASPETGPVLFHESGSGLAVLTFGPVLAAAGIALESTAPGGATYALWVGVGLVVFFYTLLLVRSRRRFLRVELTASALTLGSKTQSLSQVTSLRPADEEHYGIRVLGDGPVVPRRRSPVVLRLSDGVRVVAWAQDAEEPAGALEDVLSARRRRSSDQAR